VQKKNPCLDHGESTVSIRLKSGREADKKAITPGALQEKKAKGKQRDSSRGGAARQKKVQRKEGGRCSQGGPLAASQNFPRKSMNPKITVSGRGGAQTNNGRRSGKRIIHYDRGTR